MMINYKTQLNSKFPGNMHQKANTASHHCSESSKNNKMPLILLLKIIHGAPILCTVFGCLGWPRDD